MWLMITWGRRIGNNDLIYYSKLVLEQDAEWDFSIIPEWSLGVQV